MNLGGESKIPKVPGIKGKENRGRGGARNSPLPPEFELPSKVSELEFLVAKLREEKKELENNLVASEEFGLSLTTELEDSHKRLSLSTNTLKDETIMENSALAKEWERQCTSLQHKLTVLEEELRARDEKLADNEVSLHLFT